MSAPCTGSLRASGGPFADGAPSPFAQASWPISDEFPGISRGECHEAVTRLTTLRNQGEINEVFRRGRHLRGRLMKVVVLRREEDGAPRGLFVAGKRVGGAVVRNRTRRRLKEAYRSLAASLPPGCDVAIIAYDGGATYRELHDELVGLLSRAGLPACRAGG